MPLQSKAEELSQANQEIQNQLEEKRESEVITIFGEIDRSVITQLGRLLQEKGDNCDQIDLILDSPGGDPDAAYHIIQMLVNHCDGEFNVVVPRFAKSAATLIACGADNVVMGETSELGPLDVQVKHNGSQISVLAIDRAIEKVQENFDDDNNEVAENS